MVHPVFTHWFGQWRHIGYKHSPRELELCYVEKRRERGDIMQNLKIVKGLAKVRGHCEAVFRMGLKRKLEIHCE